MDLKVSLSKTVRVSSRTMPSDFEAEGEAVGALEFAGEGALLGLD